MSVRVRFAPSPTGHLHIGGARTAIYNWAFARHAGGSFVLRIDDTDPERSTDANVQAIIRSLRWLGLDWDEGPEIGGPFGPYFQTQRSYTYTEALERMKTRGHAYPCFCSAEQLAARREVARTEGGFSGYDRACRYMPAEEAAARVAAGDSHVWRVAVPEDRGDIVFQDAIRGEVCFPGEAMDDFILLRSDGTPTYNYATVVDDWTMEMSHVIRGDDHLSNTPRQIVVYEALEAPVPTFAHMSLIFGADGKRLSKRHGATSVESYRDSGILPEALLNYLSLLGWSIDDKTTLFDRDALIREFDLGRVSSAPGVWDPEKLEWMNGVYIRELSPEEFVERMIPWLQAAGFLDSEDSTSQARRNWLLELAPLVSERIKRLDEITPKVRFLFEEPPIEASAQEKVLGAPGAGRVLDACIEALFVLESFDHETIEAALRRVPEHMDAKPKTVFQAVRVAITGSTVSLPLFESLELLGKDTSLARLHTARQLAAD